MMPCKWLEQARRDLRAARLLADNELCGESSFHSQQAAEKALKALLSALGVQPPRTHSLEYLMVLIDRKGVSTREIREASLLTDYAVEARYPDFGEEPSCDEARNAILLAQRVIEWCSTKLKNMGINCSDGEPQEPAI